MTDQSRPAESDVPTPPDDNGRPQLGRILVEAGLVDSDDLESVLERQKQTNEPLGRLLVEGGYVSGHSIALALAQQHQGPLKTEYGFATPSISTPSQSASPPPLDPPRSPDPEPLPPLRTVAPLQVAPEPFQVAPEPLQVAPEPVPPLEPSGPLEPVVALEPIAPPEPVELPELVLPPEPVELPELVLPPEPVELPELVMPPEPVELPELVLPPEPVELPELVIPPEPVAPAEPEPATVNIEHYEQLARELDERDAATRAQLEELGGRLASVSDEHREALGSLEAFRERAEGLQRRVDDDVQRLEEAAAAIAGLEAELAAERAKPATPATPTAHVHTDDGHVLFVATIDGYQLLERAGPPPPVGDVLELPENGGSYRVTRLGASPFPGDRGRCAYLELA